MAKDLFLIPLGGSGGGGERGIQGVQGATGSQGATGAQGTAGTNGLQGIQGIKGTDGTNGADGSQGIQGIAGQNGTNGLQGIQGADGASIQGLQGEQGAAGASIQGSQGNQGIQGADGASIQGLQGEQGIQGTAGQNGTNGVDGLQGIQGIMGIQGAAGSGGGGATRYDISTKSQAELAEFYQNWQTIMASNDVYVGEYPVTSVIPEYTVQGYTALLVEYNIKFALEADATTQTELVKGDVGAWYILPNGINGEYSANVTMPSKDYVDAVANTKQDTLTAGTNISIINNTISAGGGSVALSFTLADDSVVNYTVLTN